MFDPIKSESHSGNQLSLKGNGEVEVETHSNPPKPLKNNQYYVEDFSQHHINRGQVEINKLLTVVNEKTHAALEKLEAAVEKLANKESIDAKALKAAIKAVHEAHQKVAGPFPPGCNTELVDRPPTPTGPPPTGPNPTD